MKAWIKTKIIGEGAEDDPKRPYLANQRVTVSMMKIDREACLCRVAGTPEQINTILEDAETTQLTDEEAGQIIKSKYQNSDLENLDIADPEIDEIAKSLGLDPKIRGDIQIPTKGKQVLQDQENYLMAHISEKLGLTKDFWDTEAKKSKWEKGIEIEREIKDGKIEAHEFVLSRIREKLKEKFSKQSAALGA